MLLRRVGARAAPHCCRRALSVSPRTDGEYTDLLHDQLAARFDESLLQFRPMWDAIATAVADNHLAPSSILDLASGAGEPACTLARRFPMAHVVSSDHSTDERERAAQHAQSLGLSERVSIEPIDLAELHVCAQLEADGSEDLPQCDVVTCSLGLFMLPPEEQEPCMRGIRAILSPGGLFVASVWDHMPLIEMGSRCVSAASGRSGSHSSYDPTSLGGGHADAVLERVGLVTTGCAHHNAVNDLPLRLGKHGSDAAWMLGLMPHVAALAELSQLPSEQLPTGVFGRARAAFEEEVVREAYVEAHSGDVVVPLRWRMLCARRPLA